MNALILLALIIVILMIVLHRSGGGVEKMENRQPAKPGKSYVKLYEGFNHTQKVFDKGVDKSMNFYERILRPINLKTIDINVTADGSTVMPNAPRGVTIWSVYPNDPTASTEATGVTTSAYADAAYAFRANSPKYQHIVTVNPGEHVTMELDVPVKRIFMVANI